jgi:outer membrane lipoprotein SlyB
VLRSVTFGLLAVGLAGVAGCTPNYSPNTYAAGAVQQANKVEPAIVVGFRQVAISANGTVGAVTGGAAGGVLGSQSGTFGINSALGTVGGTAIGSLLGTAVEHVTGDTKGWEYIVRKPDGSLLSVTQREESPIALGQKVLVITGSQARIVPDYSMATEPAPAPAPAKPKADEAPIMKDSPPPAEPTASVIPDPFVPAPVPTEPVAPPT